MYNLRSIYGILGLVFCFFLFESCASKKNIETKQPTPATPSPVQKHSQSDAKKHYGLALQKTEQAQYLEATELWKNFLDFYPADIESEKALYYYAMAMFYSGKSKDAQEPLQTLLEDTKNSALLVDGRLLLAEIYLKRAKTDSALALTFDLLPDKDLEKKAGLKRLKKTPHLNPAQKIQILTLRGQTYGALGDENNANQALLNAKNQLDGLDHKKLNDKEIQHLTATLAWRQTEVLNLICRKKIPFPNTLSEAEFLDYAQNHYNCAKPAQGYFCKVVEAKDKKIYQQTLQAYVALVKTPLEITSNLPPPAREVRKKEQRMFYEQELKELIENTVSAYSKEYQNLDSCKAYRLFN